jgi:NAD(P)-dependent dehydrogenase (short-subunit alcohol dehydrogenase family)
MALASNKLYGKTALITGGTGGIGKETARGLAQLGATVVVVGRDAGRGKAAVADLQRTTGNQDIHLLLADLSSQQNVRRAAEEFQHGFSELHILVNNVAGIYRTRQETVDGIEATFAVGHLAPFLLTQLLLPMLEASAPSRIINVSSDGHSMAKLNFDDLQAKRWYRGLDAYLQVKLANLLFTYELARRLDGTGVTVNAVDPGGARTQLIESTTSDMLPPLLKILFPLIKRFGLTSIEKAAESSIYAATSPDIAEITGKYFGPKLTEIQSSKASYDVEAARRLWRISEELTAIAVSERLAV